MSTPTETYEWAQSCSRELRYAEAGGQRFNRQGWATGRAYWTGAEWRVPAVRPMKLLDAVDQGTCTARPRPSCSRPDGQRLRAWSPGHSWTDTGTSCEVTP